MVGIAKSDREIQVPELGSGFARSCKAYLLGAMHDGTVRNRTLRISQREHSYVLLVRDLIFLSGGRAWIYREGKTRNLYVVEFSRSFLDGFKIDSEREELDYVRGYFDAEGGIPRSSSVKPYLYFAQKDLRDLDAVRRILLRNGVLCGGIHNPSQRADPDYWRFYVSRKSHKRFSEIVALGTLVRVGC